MNDLLKEINLKKKIAIENMAHEIGKLCADKSAAYGDSVGSTGAMLCVLWPWGIEPRMYKDAAVIIRVLDKINRIAQGDKDAFSESPWADIAGYAIRMALEDKEG